MTRVVTYARDFGGLTLAVEQQEHLRALFAAQKILAADDPAADSLGVPLYGYILQCISDISYDLDGAPVLSPKAGVDKAVWSWIEGAADVNAGEGFYADFIREYTKKQYELRGGDPSEAEIRNQEASNNIAFKLAEDILNEKGRLPGVVALGSIDAGQAASAVFRQGEHMDDGDYAPWAGTLLFPFLGFDNFTKDLLLSNEDTFAYVDGVLTYVKHNLGTYDLIAAIEASQYAAVVAGVGGVENVGQSFYNLIFGPDVVDTDQEFLVAEIDKYFFDSYGLTYVDGFEPGDDLPFTRVSAQFGETYIVGTYEDDLSLATSSGDDVVNAGLGNDVIKASADSDLIDGGYGEDTVVYSNTTFETVVHFNAEISAELYDFRIEVEKSGWKDYLYGVEYLYLGKGDDTLILGAMDFSKAKDFLGVDFGGNDEEGDLLDASSAGAALVMGSLGDDTFSINGQFYVKDVEKVIGSAFSDVIETGAGNDTLIGGAGSDKLKGGAGQDTYIFDGSAGVDTIFDSDGVIKYLQNTLHGGKALMAGADVWRDAYATYNLINAGAGTDLLITIGDGSVIIKDWAPGKFGITLEESEAEGEVQEPAPSVVIMGDLKDKDFDLSEPGIQAESDSWGNTITVPGSAEANKEDSLTDHAGNDEVRGLGGDDYIYAKWGGNDLLNGGAGDDEVEDAGGGDDFLDGGIGDDILRDSDSGADTLVGGEGMDRLFSGDDDDRLFGEQVTTLEDAIKADKGQGLDERGDWMDSGDGDDLLIGASAKDALIGGDGKDTLFGGAGDDFLVGDGESKNVTAEWVADLGTEELGGVTYYKLELEGARVGNTEGDDDYLDGGSGNDWIAGGAGSDWLNGGIGNDVLGGDAGNDSLVGGEGHDVLLGDNQDAPGGGGVVSSLHGRDFLDAGAGNDTLTGFGNDDLLFGGDDDDLIEGDDPNLTGLNGDAPEYHGNDLLDGGSGNDTLYGGGRDDTMQGGGDNDHLYGDYSDWNKSYQGNDLLDGGDGDDFLYGAGGKDTLIGGIGADYLDGDKSGMPEDAQDADSLQGGAGNDSLWGGGGADSLYGGADNDLLNGDYFDQPTAVDGKDYLDGGVGADTLWGNGGGDTLLGGQGKDYLFGGTGDNVLDGGSDNDYLGAEGGNDTYIFGAGYGSDVIADTGGQNTLRLGAGFSPQGLDAAVVLLNGSSALRLVNSSGDVVFIQNYQLWASSRFEFPDGSSLSFAEVMQRVKTPIDEVAAGGQEDNLFGSNLDDRISGKDGDDQITGQGGDDILDGGLGNDAFIFRAGDGDDTLIDSEGYNVVRFSAGITRESLSFSHAYSSEGKHILQVQYPGGEVSITDGAFSTVSRFEFADGSTLSLAEAMEGAPAIRLSADDSGKSFYGGNGADTLLGGKGDDVIAAQAGNDQLYGGAGRDLLNGNSGNDLIYGDAGDDQLFGGLGDDTLVGGGGNDILSGQGGNNTYIFQSGMGRDIVVVEEGAGSILRLAPDIDIQGITAYRDNDDLVIEYRHPGCGVVLQDYYLDASPQWQVEFSNELQDLQSFVQSLESPASDSLGFYEAAFKQRVIDSFGELYSDYSMDASGRYIYRSTVSAGSEIRNYETIYEIRFEPSSVSDVPEWMRDTLNTWQYLEDGAAVLMGGSSSTHTDVTTQTFKVPKSESFQLSSGGASSGGFTYYSVGSGGFSFSNNETVTATFDAYGNISGWIVGSSHSSSGGGAENAGERLVTTITTRQEISDIYKTVTGGDGGGVTQVEYGNIFYAGAGDDLLVARSYDSHQENHTHDWQYLVGQEQHPYVWRGYAYGVMLSGGQGDDTILGSVNDDILVGGGGADVLYGGLGVDTYVITSGSGNDVVADFIAPYFYMDAEDGEPLEGPLYDTHSVNGKDLVVLPEGVSLDQLRLSYGTAVVNGLHHALMKERYEPGPAAWIHTLYATLDISWGVGQRIQVVLPGAEDAAGTGIELFRFADGTVLTLAQLLAHAGLGSIPDPMLSNVQIASNGSVAGGIGNDTLIGSGQIFGWAGNDALVGSEYDDFLDGGQGRDDMSGGVGNDTYVVDDGLDIVRETVDGGVDSVESFISYRLGDNVENLHLVDGEAIDGTGNGEGNELSGNSSNNVLKGLGGDDYLWGDLGNDTLDGGIGADYMNGGDGDDTYYVDLIGDEVFEWPEGGIDTVRSSIDYVLGEGVEKLILTGGGVRAEGNSEANSLYGNALSNVLLGLAGDDALDGKAGSDTMFGGLGDDTYVVDSATDLVVENYGQGDDHVKSSVSYGLSENIERITLTGNGAINAVGNSLANTLKGNAAANQLTGGQGNDGLYGGLGNDTYVFARGDGADRVTDTDTTAGNLDRLVVSDVMHDQLWFRMVGSHLEIQVIGTSDRVTVSNWGLGADNQLEQIVAGDGVAISNTQVANLIEAMAAFAPPPLGQTQLSTGQHAALDSVLAANWQ